MLSYDKCLFLCDLFHLESSYLNPLIVLLLALWRGFQDGRTQKPMGSKRWYHLRMALQPTQRTQEGPWHTAFLTLSSHEPFDVPYNRLEDKIPNTCQTQRHRHAYYSPSLCKRYPDGVNDNQSRGVESKIITAEFMTSLRDRRLTGTFATTLSPEE